MATRAPEVRSPLPIRVPAPAVRAAQAAAAVRVSQPSEPAEGEAERVARRVVAMPAAAAEAPMARRMNALVPAAPAAGPSALGVGHSVGRPLPRRVRRDMEPRFGADFSAVRVHTGDSAARTSRRLNAAAFTVGRDVFFGRGRFQPDTASGRGLIAHELTHTIQQGGAAQPADVQRSVDTTVRERSVPRVQRLGIQDALDYFAEKAEFIPGFSMLALLLGFNPVSLRSVPRTAANLLRALIRLLPGGALVTQALDNHGIVERVAAWVEGQLAALGDIGSAIRQSIDEFLDGLGWSDIFDLGSVWDRAKRIVTAPIDRIIAFGTGLIGGIVDFVKDAILRPLASLIEPTRGYPLLKAVLGFDPVTGDPVPRNATTLIGGFMTLIGQDEVWQNIQRGNAIGQAWAWFQGAVTGYLGFVTQIPSLFLNAFRSLELVDIILVPRAFAKIVGVFASFYGRFFSWALGTVISLLEIIISVVAPGAMDYLRRAGAAFQTILRDPIGFCRNLVLAAKTGLQRFARNFLRHLTAGLLDWLTGSLPGIHIPQSFSLPEIFKFVMSVLGLTWANLRAKLVREVGEPAVKAMEAGFEIVVTLVRDGPVAAWEQLKQSLSDLKQMAIDGIMDMVVDFVVIKAIPKLVSLFIPGPGFITAAIAIYDTVMTFIRQLSRLAHLVKGYIDAIVAIATGSIETAAAAVEAQAARYLSLAITILAGMAGFGKVSKRVQDVLERIRKPIDKAMDRVVGWVVRIAKSFIAKGKAAVGKLFNWGSVKGVFKDADGHGHTVFIRTSTGAPRLVVASDEMAAEQFVNAFTAQKGAAFAADKKNAAKIAAARNAIAGAQSAVANLDAAQKANKDAATTDQLQRALLESNVAVTEALRLLVGEGALSLELKAKYLLEGLTGTYGSMPKPTGDNFTADHQPQAAVLQAAQKFGYFDKAGKLVARAADRAKAGFAINLHKIRHEAGATFGGKGTKTKKEFEDRVKPLAMGKDEPEQRRIVIAELKVDLGRDVAAMKTVCAAGSAYWTDLTSQITDPTQRKELIGEVSARIIKGEDQIAKQDLDSLVG